MGKKAQMTCRCGGKLTYAHNVKRSTDDTQCVAVRECRECHAVAVDVYTWTREFRDDKKNPAETGP